MDDVIIVRAEIRTAENNVHLGEFAWQVIDNQGTATPKGSWVPQALLSKIIPLLAEGKTIQLRRVSRHEVT